MTAIHRFARALPVLATAIALAGCVTLGPTASPTVPPTAVPTASPPPTARPTLPPTAPPTLPPTTPPTAPPTAPATAPPTTPPTAPPVTAPPTSSPEAAELDPNQEARYGSPEPPLESGFEPDPYSVAIISGGPINVAYLENGCVGYAEPNPDFEVQYTAGAQTLLRFYFVADTPGEDATLIINDPVSGWHCNDDFSDSTHDPSIDFSPPLSGYYDIWVGSYSSGDFVAGTLYITELSSNHP